MNKVVAVPATNLLAKISNAFQFNTNATVTPIVMIKVMRIMAATKYFHKLGPLVQLCHSECSLVGIFIGVIPA